MSLGIVGNSIIKSDIYSMISFKDEAAGLDAQAKIQEE
jgi:hypothetical protein